MDDCSWQIVLKTYGPPRLQGVLSSSAADQSATTYPASEVSSRPRWRYARPGPHKLFGVVRRFQRQASGAPFDCQAISSSPSRKPRLHDRRFRSSERILRGHGYRPGVKRFPALQHRPGDPRQLVGQGDDHDIAMGPAHQPFHPPAKRRLALGHIGQSRTRSMDQLPAQVFVAALADPRAASACRRLLN